MAKAQRSISVSEFFAKNRHLLGFDNPRKALLTAVKEAVDNALDACEEAGILPVVEMRDRAGRRDALPRDRAGQRPGHRPAADSQHLRPAALRQQVPPPADEPRPAGHRHLGGGHVRAADHRQAGADHLARLGRAGRRIYFELQIDTRTNRPVIITRRDRRVGLPPRHAGGDRAGGPLPARAGRAWTSTLQQTAIANPHVTLIYHAPDGRTDTLRRRDDRPAAAAQGDPPAPPRHRAGRADQDGCTTPRPARCGSSSPASSRASARAWPGRS